MYLLPSSITNSLARLCLTCFTCSLGLTRLFGQSAYVANLGGNSVSIVRTVVSTITVGTYPIALAISPSSAQVYVVDQNSNQVSIIDRASNHVVRTISVGT